jgi:hypothetical protein
MSYLCKDYRCARPHGGAVSFCPYCGVAQQDRVVVTERRSKTVVATNRNAAGGGSGLSQPIPAPDTAVGAAQPAASTPPIPSVPGPHAHSPKKHAGKALALAAAVVIALGIGAARTGALGPARAAYVAAPCDGPIVSEMSFLVDLPAAADEATKAEVLARLSHYLDAAHAGARRVSLFSPARGAGETAGPLVSVCSARQALAWLLPGRGLDPQLKSRFIAAVTAELNRRGAVTGRVALTELLSDVSVSQYVRAPVNTLIVFSSFIEHSGRFSLEKCRNARDAVDAYRDTRAGGVERPAFKNTRVSLNVIPDVGTERDIVRCRGQFWNWYFGDLEGKDARVSMEYLPGGAAKL